MKTSLIIPAADEEKTIDAILKKAKHHVDEIIVVDDASTDSTKDICKENEVRIITNPARQGYSSSIQKGIDAAKGDIIFTMDADGEHDPDDIPNFIRLAKPFVVGSRTELPRPMEKKISEICRTKYKFEDPFCGFRMFEKKLLKELVPFAWKDDYGLSFVIDAAKKFGVVNCRIRDIGHRQDPRIGSDDTIDKKLAVIYEGIR